MVDFTVFPNAGSTEVAGGSGNDVLGGYTGDDTLIGGAGDDYFYEGRLAWGGPSIGPFVQYRNYDIGSGNDVIHGGEGTDVLSYVGSSPGLVIDLQQGLATSSQWQDSFSGIEQFITGAGHDLVFGDMADLAVAMASGNDTLQAGSGLFYASGGWGDDLLDLSRVQTGLEIDLLNGTTSSGLVIVEFESIIGSALGANRIVGDDDKNFLGGGAADDSLTGLWGDDTLQGQGGADMLVGSHGNDKIFSGTGDDTVDAGESDDRVVNSGGADVIYGGSGIDTLIGSDGADRLFSGNGGGFHESAEMLKGGAGNDTLTATSFKVKVYGGDGEDRLVGSGTQYGGAGNDRLISEPQTGYSGVLIGGDGDDWLQAVNGSEAWYGGGGNDTIAGYAGTLGGRMFAGDGNDVIIGLKRPASSAAATVAPALESYESGVLLGAGDDVIRKTAKLAGNIYGGAGNDVIPISWGKVDGGAGNDFIDVAFLRFDASGGAGDDTLILRDSQYHTDGFYGGTGNDTVVLGKAGGPPVFERFVGTGGAGYDRLTVYDGQILVSETPIYETVGDKVYLTTVSGFEEIIIASTRVYARFIRTDDQLVFGDTHDILTIKTSGNSYELGGGNDDITLSATDLTVDAGGGKDTISSSVTGSDDFVIYAGAGHDLIGLIGSGRVDAGTGNDRLSLTGSIVADAGTGDDKIDVHSDVELYGGSGNDHVTYGRVHLEYESGVLVFVQAIGDLRGSISDLGDGNDMAIVQSVPDEIALGAGDDRLLMASGQVRKLLLAGGDGKDHFEFKFDWSSGTVRILDFDTGEDRLALFGATSVSELDSIEASGSGVKITERGWVVYLSGVGIDEVQDQMLAPLYSSWI